MPPRWSEETRGGADRARTWVRWSSSAVDRLGARHRARARHRLVPGAADSHAGRQDRHALGRALIIASVPVFVLVTTVVLFSVWRFRMRPGEENARRAADPRQHAPRGHLDRDPGARDRSALCAYAYDRRCTTSRRRPPRATSASVNVTGEQFAWTFDYNEQRQEVHVAQLYLPGRSRVKFNGPLQGRPPRLLGPGLAHEDRRRARASRRTTA